MAGITNKYRLPLIVIVGPTASGKTGVSIRLAKEIGGEVISADSRAIYRGLDIGTAKPSIEERQGIPHWGIDIADPGDRFTAVDFKRYAEQKISEIRARGHVPILVGGTGLYVDSIVYDFQFSEESNDVQRRLYFEQFDIDWLHKYCEQNNVKIPENRFNKRYVVNNIIRNGHDLKRMSRPIADCVIVGITTEKTVLRQRIHDRAQTMFDGNIVGEAVKAADKFGWDNAAMTGNIYPLVRRMLAGEITKEAAIELFEILDWHLAKRQLTWFRRSPDIVWKSLDDVYTHLMQELVDVFNS